jgi:hypothetical protein
MFIVLTRIFGVFGMQKKNVALSALLRYIDGTTMYMVVGDKMVAASPTWPLHERDTMWAPM